MIPTQSALAPVKAAEGVASEMIPHDAPQILANRTASCHHRSSQRRRLSGQRGRGLLAVSVGVDLGVSKRQARSGRQKPGKPRRPHTLDTPAPHLHNQARFEP